MTDSTTLAPKLDLVLKALNLSRGRLAADLQVNKSMVSRWLSGAVAPSSHNLAQLTRLVAEKAPGFTLLDWDRDLPALAAQLGVQPAAKAEGVVGEGLTLASLDVARRETPRRGGAYEGLWRINPPSATRPGLFFNDAALIRREGDLLRMFWGGSDWFCSGWLMSVAGQLYGALTDEADDSILFCILNGIGVPQADAIDGLMLGNALNNVPTAMACLFERTGEIGDDPVGEEQRFREACKQLQLIEPSPAVRAHLLRDIGPVAVESGGEMVLRAPSSRSMSRASPVGGWARAVQPPQTSTD